MTRSGRKRPPSGGRLAVAGFVVALVAAACGSNWGPTGPVPTLQLSPLASPSAAASASAASAAPSSAPTPSAAASPSASPSAAPTAMPTAAGTEALPTASVIASAPTTVSPVPTATATQPTASLRWSDCGDPFQCATLSVPLDYRNAGGRRITLALIRLPASDPLRRIGSLLTNPGGPGGSGIDYVRQAGETTFSSELRSHLDIVGWDPRGVGESTPVTCVDAAAYDRLYHLDPTPDTPEEKQALIDGSKEFVAACQARSGDLLPFMTSEDTARDMDQIRAALGDSKLTYLGFSYGTLLGTVYAGLFPDHVRALALDGALDPAQSSVESLVTQAVGFEHALNAFLADCARRPSCQFNSGGRPGEALDKLMAGIDATPLPATAIGDARLVGQGEAWTGLLYALYSRDSWSILAQGLALAQRGDGSILLLMADAYNSRNADGTYSNMFAAFFATACTDNVVPTDPAAADELAPRLTREAPRLGAVFAYGTLGYACTFWPIHATKDRGAIRAEGAPPILVIGTSGDPATPFEWAQNLAGELASGVLLTRKGEGHTGYSDSPCVQGHVDDYLINLKVPPANTVCDP